MNCDEWKAFFQDYVTGGLSAPAREAIDRHLSDCAACLTEVRAHKMVDNHLRAQPVVDVPAGLVDRIVGRVWSSRPTVRHELIPMAAVFLAAVSLGAAFVFSGLADRIPTAQVDAARQTLETSFRSALSITDLFTR